MSAVTVVPMTAAHVDAVAALEAGCFSRPWSADALREALAQPTAHFLVAMADTQVVGYLGLYAVADEGTIANVAVAPAARRQGVASALLRQASSFGAAVGLSRLMLEVRVSNAAAVALYERLGFVRDGVRPRFYDRPTEDAALYSLYI